MATANSSYEQIHVSDSGAGDPVTLVHCSAASGKRKCDSRETPKAQSKYDD